MGIVYILWSWPGHTSTIYAGLQLDIPIPHQQNLLEGLFIFLREFRALAIGVQRS